jgi:polar amino acid transport system substrate-binding protein
LRVLATQFFVVALAVLMLTAGLRDPAMAQGGGDAGRPFTPEEWKYGRRLDESQLRFCVDRRDGDWQIAKEIGEAIAGGLLLEGQPYVVENKSITQALDDIYGIMLEHCDLHMGFKLIPEGYPNWAAVTRAYYETQYVFVTSDPDIHALADLAPGHPIAATIGTMAHIRLVSYLMALPAEDRWPTYPMGTNDLALESLLNGTADVALVWAPSLWAKQREDAAYADFHVIDPKPLPPTTLGVGALLLSNETFLRTAVDEAITALISDGTIQSILDKYKFPATAKP